MSNFALLSFPFRSFLHFSRNGPPPMMVWSSSQATTCPSLQNLKLDQWDCDVWCLQNLKMLVFPCFKKHALWCVSIGSGGSHWATSLMRGMDWSVRWLTIGFVPLISTRLIFIIFFYLFYLFCLFNISQTIWNLEKYKKLKLFGIIFSSIIWFLFIFLTNRKLKIIFLFLCVIFNVFKS
jgi:hypothetical protein